MFALVAQVTEVTLADPKPKVVAAKETNYNSDDSLERSQDPSGSPKNGDGKNDVVREERPRLNDLRRPSEVSHIRAKQPDMFLDVLYEDYLCIIRHIQVKHGAVRRTSPGRVESDYRRH